MFKRILLIFDILRVLNNVEAYTQSLKDNNVTFDRRRNIIEGNELEEEVEVRSPELIISKEISKINHK